MPITSAPTEYGDPDFSRFLRITFARLHGWPEDELREKPLIGVLNTQSEVNRCHAHFGPLVDDIKRGVVVAGGIPLEFPTISIGEIFSHPTSMLLRNLAAMDTEMMIKSQPLDGVVLLGGCDKTIPAQLMGAASANVPAIFVSGGPMANGQYRRRILGACTDCRGYWQEHRAGTLKEPLDAVGAELAPGPGHCMVMGTASTMAVMAEAMGVMLSGGAAIPATHQARRLHAYQSGRSIVALVKRGVSPDQILTMSALVNGVVAMLAVGGSTNAIIHVLALSRRLGLPLDLDTVDRLSRQVPVLANLRPVGAYQMEDFYHAGGVPALLAELTDYLDLSAPTVDGVPLGILLERRRPAKAGGEVIRDRRHPLHVSGGLTVLKGNLAPRGAVIKSKAAVNPNLLEHVGPAVVFESVDDLRRLDDPALQVTADSVLVLRNAGPVGAPGMPEVGSFPLPQKLLRQGVRDMVRISDARMSGTAGGTVVLHVAPEAAVGGPLALVRDGDPVELSVGRQEINVLVEPSVLAARQRSQDGAGRRIRRGYEWLYVHHVTQADEGCDFDFLTAAGAAPAAPEC